METKSGGYVDEEKGVVETDDSWIFTGYASIFNTKDQGGDTVMPGAFAKSLRDYGMPILLFQRKHEECPVGVITEARQNKRGLWVKGELPRQDTRNSGWLVPQLKKRSIKGMSIGYRTIEPEKRKADGARLRKQVRLYECSFVSMPMHLDAGLESLKHMSRDHDLESRLLCASSATRRSPSAMILMNAWKSPSDAWKRA
jgi:uncharacterized protein